MVRSYRNNLSFPSHFDHKLCVECDRIAAGRTAILLEGGRHKMARDHILRLKAEWAFWDRHQGNTHVCPELDLVIACSP
jgi:hypothetical protein